MKLQAIIGFAVAPFAVLGVVACGGGDRGAPPQTPANETTTTAAAAPPAAPADTMGSSTPPPGSPMDTTAGTPPSGGTPGGTLTSTGPGSSPSQATSPSTGSPGGVLISDAQIVAIVEAANGGELDQAHEAVRKAKNTRVKQFAQHMLTDHTAAGTKLTGVESKGSISPQESPTSTQLKSGGAQVMSDLKSAKGASFDTTYIDAQVKEHNGLLDLLDNKLIPQAQNADLRTMLQDVRKTVAAHLKMAQDIQSTLTK